MLDYIDSKVFINFSQWLKINSYELDQGKLKGKCRDKVKSIKKMLEIALK